MEYEYQMSVRVKALFLVEKALSLGLDINVKGYGEGNDKVSFEGWKELFDAIIVKQ